MRARWSSCDIYADLLLGTEPGVTVPAAAAMVYLHVPVTTALTMSDAGCVLDGYGPIPAVIARELMTNPNSVLRKVITDTDGTVTGIGSTKRRPNVALAEMIRARDRECTAPGCHRTARHCDLDHHDEVQHGGHTEPDNLGPKCRHDHHRKDHPDWTLDYDPATGIGTITTPAGRTYTQARDPIIHPPPRPVTPRPAASPLWTPGQPASRSMPLRQRTQRTRRRYPQNSAPATSWSPSPGVYRSGHGPGQA